MYTCSEISTSDFEPWSTCKYREIEREKLYNVLVYESKLLSQEKDLFVCTCICTFVAPPMTMGVLSMAVVIWEPCCLLKEHKPGTQYRTNSAMY